jgi:CBS domain-containing protein
MDVSEEGGSQLLTTPVARIMATDLLMVGPEDGVAAAADRMKAHHVGCALVADAAGALVGVFTERDLLMRVVGAGLAPGAVSVGDVMTANPRTIDASMSVSAAFDLMNEHGFRHAPVMEDGGVVGVVSMRDLFRVRMRHVEMQLSEETTSLREAKEMLGLDQDARSSALIQSSGTKLIE